MYRRTHDTAVGVLVGSGVAVGWGVDVGVAVRVGCGVLVGLGVLVGVACSLVAVAIGFLIRAFPGLAMRGGICTGRAVIVGEGSLVAVGAARVSVGSTLATRRVGAVVALLVVTGVATEIAGRCVAALSVPCLPPEPHPDIVSEIAIPSTDSDQANLVLRILTPLPDRCGTFSTSSLTLCVEAASSGRPITSLLTWCRVTTSMVWY